MTLPAEPPGTHGLPDLKDLSLKRFPREDALMALSAMRFIEGELGSPLRGQMLLVAFSGGADSTALLVMFRALSPHCGFRLCAAHLDHGIRPESSADADAAAALCATLGVPLTVHRADVAGLARRRHCGLEEAGRIARKTWLEECRVSCGASWVLEAHHSGDLAEDVLMRLVRGAGWPALGGMKAVADMPGTHVLRPLLMLDKKRLMAMLRRLGVPWREDSSNAGLDCRRNRMRNAVLPLLLAENPRFYDSVRALWRMARSSERTGSAVPEGILTADSGDVLLPAADLAAADAEKRARMYLSAVRRMGRGQAREATLAAMDRAWLARRFPRVFQFGGRLRALVSAEGVRFYAEDGGGESPGAMARD